LAELALWLRSGAATKEIVADARDRGAVVAGGSRNDGGPSTPARAQSRRSARRRPTATSRYSGADPDVHLAGPDVHLADPDMHLAGPYVHLADPDNGIVSQMPKGRYGFDTCTSMAALSV